MIPIQTRHFGRFSLLKRLPDFADFELMVLQNSEYPPSITNVSPVWYALASLIR